MHTEDKFTDFSRIKEEIERETEKLTGNNKKVSSTPINLRIYSPHVLTLTLVDLPGLTKVPVGDQPKDIEVQIRDMVMHYISNPNAIILSVSAANVDLANSDALKVSRDVDPLGLRTIGVLTKLDLMDKGTNALDILQGRIYPLRLGFIGVVNRSQEDINNDVSIKTSLDKEREFFMTHPQYNTIHEKCGYNYLANTLNKILMNHVKQCIPDLKRQVTSKLLKTRSLLNELGDPQLNQNKGTLLLHIINKYSDLFRANIDGSLPNCPLNELYGGARIASIFTDKFGKAMDAFECSLNTDDIKLAITSSMGINNPLFIPENAFLQLIKKQILRLEETSLACSDLVLEELKKISDRIDVPELRHFYILKDRIIEVVHNLLMECHGPARDMISSLIEIEQGYINTKHPDFVEIKSMVRDRMTKSEKSYSTPKTTDTTSLSSKDIVYNDMFMVDILRDMILSYFAVVKKNIKDRVPKTIMHFMVNASKVRLHSELIGNLYKEDLFDTILKESDDVSQRRKEYNRMVQMLMNAQTILMDV